MNGFIRVYRSMLDWEWSNDPNTFSIFIHLLLGASFTDKRWHGIVVKAGQIVTSISSLSKKTGVSVQGVRTSLKRLKSTGEITSESCSQYSVITVVNWAKFQSVDDQTNKRPTDESTGDQQAVNKPSTSDQQHRKNVKNVKNVNKGINVDTGTEKPASRFTPPTADEASDFCKQSGIVTDVQAFVDHYTSNGWHVGRTPMKDWHAALRN